MWIIGTRAWESIKTKCLKKDGVKTEELAKIGMLETEFGKWKLLVSDGDAKGWEKRESEGEDVTPTAVAKEVIGLRPRARYPNDEGDEKGTGHVARGRRREGSSANEDNGDWRRLFDVAPLPRDPPIREGVNRRPPKPLPIRRERFREGGAARWRPLRNSSVVLRYIRNSRRWPFFALSRAKGRAVFAPRLYAEI